MFLQILQNVLKKRIDVLIYYIGKGYFLLGTLNRGIIFKISHTLFRVPIAQMVERPLREAGGLGFDTWPCHTKGV